MRKSTNCVRLIFTSSHPGSHFYLFRYRAMYKAPPFLFTFLFYFCVTADNAACVLPLCRYVRTCMMRADISFLSPYSFRGRKAAFTTMRYIQSSQARSISSWFLLRGMLLFPLRAQSHLSGFLNRTRVKTCCKKGMQHSAIAKEKSRRRNKF